MNTPVHFPPEALEQAAAAQRLLVRSQSYPMITTAAEYEQAGAELKGIKGRQATLEEWFERLKAPIRAAGKAVDDFFNPPRTYLKQAETAIKSSMTTYDREQKAVRERAEREAAAAAERERERLRKEAQAIEDAARKKREQDEARAAEKRAAEEAKARELEEQGRAAQAAERRAAAEDAEQRRQAEIAERERASQQQAESKRIAADTMPSQPVIAHAAPKVAGVSTRYDWHGEVTDKLALVKAVAAGNAPLDLLDVNMPMLNKLAKALKSALAYAGVKAVERPTMSAKK